MVGDRDHPRYPDVLVARVGCGEGFLGGSFQPVIEFLCHPISQLGEQRLGVQAGHEHAEKPGNAAQLVKIADQCPACAWVLDLDGNLPPVAPDAAVHLADRGCGGRLVVEIGEAVPPLFAHVAREHLVHSLGRQRRCGFLQLGQGSPVRAGDLRGQCGLEDGYRLPELHGAALELAKDLEDLRCCPQLNFLGYQLSWPAAQPLASSQRSPARQRDRQHGQFRRAGDSMAGQIVHDPPVLRPARAYRPRTRSGTAGRHREKPGRMLRTRSRARQALVFQNGLAARGEAKFSARGRFPGPKVPGLWVFRPLCPGLVWGV